MNNLYAINIHDIVEYSWFAFLYTQYKCTFNVHVYHHKTIHILECSVLVLSHLNIIIKKLFENKTVLHPFILKKKKLYIFSCLVQLEERDQKWGHQKVHPGWGTQGGRTSRTGRRRPCKVPGQAQGRHDDRRLSDARLSCRRIRSNRGVRSCRTGKNEIAKMANWWSAMEWYKSTIVVVNKLSVM